MSSSCHTRKRTSRGSFQKPRADSVAAPAVRTSSRGRSTLIALLRPLRSGNGDSSLNSGPGPWCPQIRSPRQTGTATTTRTGRQTTNNIRNPVLDRVRSWPRNWGGSFLFLILKKKSSLRFLAQLGPVYGAWPYSLSARTCHNSPRLMLNSSSRLMLMLM